MGVIRSFVISFINFRLSLFSSFTVAAGSKQVGRVARVGRVGRVGERNYVSKRFLRHPDTMFRFKAVLFAK